MFTMLHGNNRYILTVHALWNCSPVQGFWISVTKELSNILGYKIPLSPSLCLPNDFTQITNQPKHKTPLWTSLTIAKKTILLHWTSKNLINKKHWENLLIESILIIKTSALLHKNNKDFTDTWKSFIDRFNL